VKPPRFEYHRPTSVEEAVSLLDDGGNDATVLAGGQSLIPTMNFRLASPETVVDINRLDALDFVREEDDDLVIGALTRQSTVEDSPLATDHCPLVVDALKQVGHRTNRNRGTFGGNLAHADPNAELPAIALVREMSFVVRSRDGTRTVPAADFFRGYMSTDLGPAELLVAVRIPVLADGRGWAFREESPRQGDYAMTGVAVTLDVVDGRCRDARLGYLAVSDRPVRLSDVEERLEGAPADEGTFADAAASAREEVDPPSDVHANSDYRRGLVEALTERALGRAADRSRTE
jgi:CO/xanthine dehydrogenase FAD-binding subunit